MATEQVADGVTRVDGSRTNFYLVEDGDAVCVVDTGYPGDFNLLMAAVEGTGHSPADISAVLLTHGHVDHIGSAERLRTEYAAPVHVHNEEANHVKGRADEVISMSYMISRLWWPKMVSFLLNAIRAGATQVQRVREVVMFGEAPAGLDLPGKPVPIFTPGHTSGHCAFHLADRGVVMTGDGLITQDSLTQAKGPRLLHEAFNHDQESAIRSLERFRNLSADTLLPGHGDPFRGSPADAVDQALAELR
jgi:glyoxylase-like metal-dependent hydrolase (beta-lactamase superfamily II)